MIFLHLLKSSDVLRHAGIDPHRLPHLPELNAPAWRLVTPVARQTSSVERSRFYDSVKNHVNDNEKKSHFLTMFNELILASKHQNYQESLKGSATIVKEAHSFKYNNSNPKLWELKHGKKDRIYFFNLTDETARYIILLMAYHKKDKNTPGDVKSYCEKTMREYLRAGTNIKICGR